MHNFQKTLALSILDFEKFASAGDKDSLLTCSFPAGKRPMSNTAYLCKQ